MASCPAASGVFHKMHVYQFFLSSILSVQRTVVCAEKLSDYFTQLLSSNRCFVVSDQVTVWASTCHPGPEYTIALLSVVRSHDICLG